MLDRLRRAFPASDPGRRGVALIVVLIVLVFALAMSPLRHAGLHTDDWAWLALASETHAPWAAYREPTMFGYFYRPTAFVLWFASERLFGDAAIAHYALGLLLHLAAAAALGAWLMALGTSRAAALAAVALFALMPATSGLALWASNRNEALAVLAGLLALRAAVDGRALWVAVLLALAITAKETGLLFALAVALQALAMPQRPVPWRVALLATSALVAIALLALRQAIVWPVDPSSPESTLSLAVVRDGLREWWVHLPQALTGLSPRAAALPVALSLILVIVAASRRAWRTKRAAAMLVGGALLLGPAVLQSPITAVVLSGEAPMAMLVNLRFYAIAALGFAVLVAASWPDAPRPRLAAAALVLVACMAGGWTSHQQAWQWAAETRAMAIDHRAAAAAVAVGEWALPPHGCIVDVQGVPLPEGVRPYFDGMLRARLPHGDPLRRCAFAADGQLPWVSFLPAEACARGHWTDAGVHVVVAIAGPMADELAGACQIVLRPSPGGLRPAATLRWPLSAP